MGVLVVCEKGTVPRHSWSCMWCLFVCCFVSFRRLFKVPERFARGTFRFSVGRHTTSEDIERACQLLLEHIRPILDQLEVQPIPDQLEIQPVPDQLEIQPTPDQLEIQPTPGQLEIQPTPDQLEIQPTPDQLEIQPTPDQHSIPQLDQLENQPARLDQHPLLQLEDADDDDDDDSVNQLAQHPLLELEQLEEDYFPNTPNTADKEVPDDSSEYSNSRLTSLSKGTDVSSKSLFSDKGGSKGEKGDEDSDVFDKMKSFFGIDSPPKNNGVKQAE